MNSNQLQTGRRSGCGRGYQYPIPFHTKDGIAQTEKTVGRGAPRVPKGALSSVIYPDARMGNLRGTIRPLQINLRRAMDGLNLKTVGRNKFDLAAVVRVHNLHLDIWPGYITSNRQHEKDILVCTQISHKVMRADTILDIIKRIFGEECDFKTAVTKQLLGSTVITRYNDRTDRIDEITYDVKPTVTFRMDDYKKISYVKYFKQRYNLNIRDVNQPMLVSHLEEKYWHPGMPEDVPFVPELSNVTGFTDEMCANFGTMREMAQYTKVGPAAYIDRLLAFNKRLQSTPESLRHLNDWYLKLSPNLVEVPARVLPYPDIIFGNKRISTNKQADWQSELRNSDMAYCVELKHWYLVTPAQDFIEALQRAGNGMRFLIKDPRIETLQNDLQSTVSQKIQECAGRNLQLIMSVVSNNNADRYSTIKKNCCYNFGIPTQVILHETITPKENSKGMDGLMSIATKVAIQMNAKLGGHPDGLQNHPRYV